MLLGSGVNLQTPERIYWFKFLVDSLLRLTVSMGRPEFWCVVRIMSYIDTWTLRNIECLYLDGDIHLKTKNVGSDASDACHSPREVV